MPRRANVIDPREAKGKRLRVRSVSAQAGGSVLVIRVKSSQEKQSIRNDTRFVHEESVGINFAGMRP